MSLDEIQRILEERAKADKIKKKSHRKKKATKKKTPPISTKKKQDKASIMLQIGNLNVQIDKKTLETLFQKIWELDLAENFELDDAIYSYFNSSKDRIRLKFDRKLLYQRIRNESFFQLSSDLRISYFEFRKNWQHLIKPYPELKMSSPRKEFVQLIKNNLKSRWVHEDGTQLSEGEFQILYRLEREPKAIERIIEYLETHWLNFIEKKDLEIFMREIRQSITKIIKESLFDLNRQKEKKSLNSHEESSKESNNKLVNELDNETNLDENKMNLDENEIN
ncbi:hypothetical protein [Candidatus Harpocratesius sp.]